MSIAFLLTTLVVVATPGTGAVYSVAIGISQGARAGVVAALGCTLGVVPHMIAAITGLAAILHASAVAFEVIKWFGVAYLLYLAWRTLRDTALMSAEEDAVPVSSWRIIRTAVLLNLLNPKLTIFFFAFLPQFVSPTQAGALPKMLVLSGVFMALTFIVFVGYGVFAALMRRHVISRPAVVTWMRRTFAAAFVAMGAKLALAER